MAYILHNMCNVYNIYNIHILHPPKRSPAECPFCSVGGIVIACSLRWQALVSGLPSAALRHQANRE